jgi:hypothetical protein
MEEALWWLFQRDITEQQKKKTKEMQDKIDYKPSEEGTQTKSGRLHTTWLYTNKEQIERVLPRTSIYSKSTYSVRKMASLGQLVANIAHSKYPLGAIRSSVVEVILGIT